MVGGYLEKGGSILNGAEALSFQLGPSIFLSPTGDNHHLLMRLAMVFDGEI